MPFLDPPTILSGPDPLTSNTVISLLPPALILPFALSENPLSLLLPAHSLLALMPVRGAFLDDAAPAD